jgi:hypothetical protein
VPEGALMMPVEIVGFVLSYDAGSVLRPDSWPARHIAYYTEDSFATNSENGVGPSAVR